MDLGEKTFQHLHKLDLVVREQGEVRSVLAHAPNLKTVHIRKLSWREVPIGTGQDAPDLWQQFDVQVVRLAPNIESFHLVVRDIPTLQALAPFSGSVVRATANCKALRKLHFHFLVESFTYPRAFPTARLRERTCAGLERSARTVACSHWQRSRAFDLQILWESWAC